MTRKILTPIRLLPVALSGLFATTAFADWSDGAVAAWTARSASLVAAVNQPIDAGAPPDASGKALLYYVDSRGFFYKQTEAEDAATAASGKYAANISAQCKGVTGELIKNGGRNMPTWGQTALQKFCAGAEATEHALVDKPSDKSRCKELASAINYARKATPGQDPEVIVKSAGELVAAAEKLRAIPILMTQKSKLLGDGTRTFSCD